MFYTSMKKNTKWYATAKGHTTGIFDTSVILCLRQVRLAETGLFVIYYTLLQNKEGGGAGRPPLPLRMVEVT